MAGREQPGARLLGARGAGADVAAQLAALLLHRAVLNGDIGCSADLSGYPDFAPIKNNTVDRNLFVASPGSGFCAYGGATSGKPYSSDPTNATNQKFTNNVFQRGGNNKCGTYGPVTSFNSSGTGNVLSGNVWDNGTPVAAAM